MKTYELLLSYTVNKHKTFNMTRFCDLLHEFIHTQKKYKIGGSILFIILSLQQFSNCIENLNLVFLIYIDLKTSRNTVYRIIFASLLFQKVSHCLEFAHTQLCLKRDTSNLRHWNSPADNEGKGDENKTGANISMYTVVDVH